MALARFVEIWLDFVGDFEVVTVVLAALLILSSTFGSRGALAGNGRRW